MVVMGGSRLSIGVLALQGAYDVHVTMLQQLGADATLVKRPDQLKGLDGLILPGGESTTFLNHLERDGFFDALSDFVQTQPTFGTCAGCILLAKRVENPVQRSFNALDITVERNAYGRQVDSTILSVPTSISRQPIEMIFIRAPRIVEAGVEVQVLARRDAAPVLVEEGHLMAATFHPELSIDTTIHQHFLRLVERYKLR